MYKLLALDLDLDETLYNSHHIIDEGNKIAIAKAKQKGVKIVPCSGRGPNYLGDLYEVLDIDHNDEYSILCNGAIVIENKSGKVISCSPMKYDKVVELFHFGIDKGLCVQVFTPDMVYVYQVDEKEKETILSFSSHIAFQNDLDTSVFKDKTIIKVLFEKQNGMAYLRTLEDELKSITDGAVTVAFSSDRYLELNALGIHKGVGLLALANYLHIDIKDTIGVGDNYNDMGLIQDAGLGIAVQNAIEPIKKIANVITKATNDENAIAEVIHTYIIKDDENA